ncbi:hypothetical protein MKS88_001569 [Plasmodium brasilianum]|uniref:Uncharacterized protein n=1 Tax=Plasmodium brasilianum TaxID=5824 RepID=A0ACB9YD58_PLABR|nr:hypothetical protein MKS88_001569 [Plasmodium brasilianum]
MEQKNKLLFCIKIATFIFLSWVCHFSNDVKKFNIFLDESYKLPTKLGTRTYRLLTKYKRNRDSDVVFLKEKIPANEKYKGKDTFRSEGLTRGSNKTCKSTPHNSVYYETYRKNKSCVCTRRDSYIGKRIFDKIYYKNSVRCATNSDFKILKRCILNKLHILPAFSLLFLPFVIVQLASIRYNESTKFIKFITSDEWNLAINVICIILTFIFILTTIYVFRKVEKYNKMLHIKSRMNNRNYCSYPRVGF